MRHDTLNWHNYGGYTEMTAPSLNIYSTNDDTSKRIIAHEGLSQKCSTDESESKNYCRVVVLTMANQHALS